MRFHRESFSFDNEEANNQGTCKTKALKIYSWKVDAEILFLRGLPWLHLIEAPVEIRAGERSNGAGRRPRRRRATPGEAASTAKLLCMEHSLAQATENNIPTATSNWFTGHHPRSSLRSSSLVASRMCRRRRDNPGLRTCTWLDRTCTADQEESQ